jgi:hypothetical protein
MRDVARDLALRAYELGRLRTSLLRAAPVVAVVAALALTFGGAAGLVWLPVTAAVWIFAHWRGGPILRGSYIGLVGGFITLALPMTILRPCCSAEAMAAGMSCCTQPSNCVTAGALLGIVLAAFLPQGPARWRAAAGTAMGVSSVAILRCSTLFGAEAIGLAGGLAAGLLVGWYARSRTWAARTDS